MSIFLYRFGAQGQGTPVGGCVTGEEPSGCLNFTISSQRGSLSLSSKAVHYMNILEKKSRAKAGSDSTHQVCRNVGGPWGTANVFPQGLCWPLGGVAGGGGLRPCWWTIWSLWLSRDSWVDTCCWSVLHWGYFLGYGGCLLDIVAWSSLHWLVDSFLILSYGKGLLGEGHTVLMRFSPTERQKFKLI